MPRKGPKEPPTRPGEDVEKEKGKEAGRNDTDPERPIHGSPPDTTGVDPADTDPRSRKHTQDAD